jgi:hypothetical protein
MVRGEILSVADLALLRFIEHDLYGPGGAEAAVSISAPKIAKALKKFHTKQNYALLNSAAKQQAPDAARVKTAAQQQTDAAQAKSRRDRETAAKKKKAAERAAAAP